MWSDFLIWEATSSSSKNTENKGFLESTSPNKKKEKKKKREGRKEAQHIEYESEEEEQNVFNAWGKIKVFFHILPSVVHFEKKENQAQQWPIEI